MSEEHLPDSIIAQLDRRFWEKIDQERATWLARQDHGEHREDAAKPVDGTDSPGG